MEEESAIRHIRLPKHLGTMHAISRFWQAFGKRICHHFMCATRHQSHHLEIDQFTQKTLANVHMPRQITFRHKSLDRFNVPGLLTRQRIFRHEYTVAIVFVDQSFFLLFVETLTKAATSTAMQTLSKLIGNTKLPFRDFEKGVIDAFATLDPCRFENPKELIDHLSATVCITRCRMIAEDPKHPDASSDTSAHAFAVQAVDEWQRKHPNEPFKTDTYEMTALPLLNSKLEAKRRLHGNAPKDDDAGAQILALQAEVRALKNGNGASRGIHRGRGRGGRGQRGRGRGAAGDRKPPTLPCSNCGKMECGRSIACPNAHAEYLITFYFGQLVLC